MTRQFQKLSHSIYECKYHIVFCPKYRYRVLKDEIAAYTQEQLYALCRQKEGIEVLELNIQPTMCQSYMAGSVSIKSS